MPAGRACDRGAPREQQVSRGAEGTCDRGTEGACLELLPLLLLLPSLLPLLLLLPPLLLCVRLAARVALCALREGSSTCLAFQADSTE